MRRSTVSFLGRCGENGRYLTFVFMLILLFGRTALIWIADVINQRAASHLKRDLREQLSEHILRLGPAYTVGNGAANWYTQLFPALKI